jgi:predicted GIY-YIG superfamily endonuclease
MAQAFFAYMLQCRDGSYYAGHTDDLEKRLAEHQMGQGSRFTNSRLPVTLVWSERFAGRDEAKEAESRLKGWNRAKKEALIAGRFDVISALASRSAVARALRDAPLREAPQGRGGRGTSNVKG